MSFDLSSMSDMFSSGTDITWSDGAKETVGRGIFGGKQGISSLLQVGSGVAQYMQDKAADRNARKTANMQAAMTEADAARSAENEKQQAERSRSLQKMLFLKSGVDLSGSPLLLMEETRRKGMENAYNITQTGKAKADLLRQQGKVQRASLLNTGLDVAKGLTSSWIQSEQLKKQLY